MIELYCLNREELDEIMESGKMDSPFGVDIDYVLLVDKTPLVLYRATLQKYNGLAKGVGSVEIQYENIFARDDKSKEDKEKYLRKGYTRQGLELLTAELMAYQIPYIHLDINPNNIGSIMVAEKCGYKKKEDSYYKYHPNVLELLYNSLGDNFTEEQKESIVERFRMRHEQYFDAPQKAIKY